MASIPTTDHKSLNLAQACLALYELHLAAGDATIRQAAKHAAAPPTITTSNAHSIVSGALKAVAFLKTRNAELVMRTVRSPTCANCCCCARSIEVLRTIEREASARSPRRSPRSGHEAAIPGRRPGSAPDDSDENESLRERAADVIPGGCSTGSKRPAALYGAQASDAALPTHYERAEGCTLITSDGLRHRVVGHGGLYNPDRYRQPMVREGGALKPTTWDNAISLLATKIDEVKKANGAGNVLFVNHHETGTFSGFLDEWLAAQGMPAHLSVDALAPQATIAANQKAYGVAWPALDFSAARLIISFGADFLDGWGMSVPQQLDWADARAKIEDAPSLVYVGARRSLTGLNADQWIAAKPGSEMAICDAITGKQTAAAASDASGVPVATIEALTAAVKAAGNGVMALCGITSADAVECGVAVAGINKTAGSVGVTIKPAARLTPVMPTWPATRNWSRPWGA